nr:hypothetical protein [Tanacetum cinerariifolium]
GQNPTPCGPDTGAACPWPAATAAATGPAPGNSGPLPERSPESGFHWRPLSPRRSGAGLPRRTARC